MLNETLWEEHAEWRQREFAPGFDAEYQTQILPLVARHLQARDAFSTSDTAKAKWRAASPDRVPRSWASIQPSHNYVRLARVKAVPATRGRTRRDAS